MFNLLILLFLREKRSVFVNKLSFLTRFIAALINFFFYYYASKAFVPEENFFPRDQNWSLFEFVIIGELILFFACDALIIFNQHLRVIIRENVLDSFLMSRTSLVKILLQMGGSSFLLSCISIVFQFFMLIFVFNISYPLLNLTKAVLLNFAFLPVFVGLGFLSAAILMLFRRGSGGIGTLVGAMGILSGAYFPVTVFPGWLEKTLLYLNPMYTLLFESRAFLKTGRGTLPFVELTSFLLVAGLFLLGLGIFVFNKSIHFYKSRGEPALLGD
jgi:ABC-2 type transport system permease protein